MKKTLKIKDYFDHLLAEIARADLEFKLQQVRFAKNNARIGAGHTDLHPLLEQEMTGDQLAMQQVELSLCLKKHSPGLLHRLWLRIRGIPPETLFKLTSRQHAGLLVTFTVSRIDAFGKMDGTVTPESAADQYVQV